MKEAKECMQECVSEFISFITSEELIAAAEKCQQEKRKTVQGEDVIFALTALGFENYAQVLTIYRARYRRNMQEEISSGLPRFAQTDNSSTTVLVEPAPEVPEDTLIPKQGAECGDSPVNLQTQRDRYEQSHRQDLEQDTQDQSSEDILTSSNPPTSESEGLAQDANNSESGTGRHPVAADRLARKLSARQVQMIAIGGTIGTGLFLGTGKSLATGGPASMLIAYAIVGFIVFITMLSLGEMAAFVPIAGSFCTFAGRFVDDAFGFALTWNYWFNDAVSMASDLVALQLILQYWTTKLPGWGLSLIFWVLLIVANIVTVSIYGELEYWLSLLKVITIIVFIILGVAVNCGANTENRYIGGHKWFIEDAPFVGGIGGFASVFVTAAFAYGGTESIAITAGETKDPARTIPQVVRNVFWRILLFYILSVLILGLNVPYTARGLDEKETRTSPFTLVFQMAGSTAAGSFINAVIMTSVLSAGNHALFAGTRLLYTLAIDRHAPIFFSNLNRNQVPWIAVLTTSAISILCFGASFIGTGQLWTWLQSIVGVSNQLSWIAIGIASLRFRAAIKIQGKEHLLPYKNWTYPWGPWFSVILNSLLVLVQGWSSFSPSFRPVTFVSLYVELPIMLVMFTGWKVLRRTRLVDLREMDLVTDTYPPEELNPADDFEKTEWKGRVYRVWRWIL
ncbi:MAG: hypothetical protein Q9208_008096 [Pyrenodesmia sp. 3 TL-2023]